MKALLTHEYTKFNPSSGKTTTFWMYTGNLAAWKPGRIWQWQWQVAPKSNWQQCTLADYEAQEERDRNDHYQDKVNGK